MDIHVTGRRVLATIADSIILGIAYSIFRALFGGPGDLTANQALALATATVAAANITSAVPM